MIYFRHSNLPVMCKLQGWRSYHDRVRVDLLCSLWFFKLRTTALSSSSSFSAYLGFSFLLPPVLSSLYSSNQMTFQNHQYISDRVQRNRLPETSCTQSVETRKIFYMHAIYFLGDWQHFLSYYIKLLFACLWWNLFISFAFVAWRGFCDISNLWIVLTSLCRNILFLVCRLVVKHVVHWGEFWVRLRIDYLYFNVM